MKIVRRTCAAARTIRIAWRAAARLARPSGAESTSAASLIASQPRRALQGIAPWQLASAPIPARRPRQATRERHAEAEHRYAAPADRPEQQGGGQRSHEPACSGEHDIKARHQSSVPRRGQFDNYGQRRDHRRGQPDANNKTQCREEQPLAVRDEAVQRGADAADEGSDND